MRFTRYTATLLFVLSIGGLVITAIVYFHVIPFADDSLPIQIAYAVILGLPFLMAMIGFVVVFSGRHSFHIAPRHHPINPAPPSHRPEENDPLIHLAVGMLVALLQDFSLGRILNPDIYGLQLRQMLEQELSYFRVYFDRGYSFYFTFYHNEPYNAHVRQELAQQDRIIEVSGVFDYYFERDGEKHPTPHGYDENPPLIRVPARMLLRIQQHQQTAQWQLVGFSDSIRGLQLGLAVA